MRSIIGKILFVAMVTGIAHSTGLAVDFDLGQIIETSPDNNSIQINDKIYKVSAVELLAVEGEPLPGSLRDLSEGSIVKVIRGTKEIDYWNATLVTVYQGEMNKKIREELELPASEAEGKSQEVTHQNGPARDTPLKLKQGVWQN